MSSTLYWEYEIEQLSRGNQGYWSKFKPLRFELILKGAVIKKLERVS